MIPVSRRYSIVLLLLAGIAAVPVTLHASGVLRTDDCAAPDALSRLENLPGTRAGTLDAPPPPLRIQHLPFEVEPEKDFDRRFGLLAAAILRSFDPARIYSSPVRFVDPNFEADERHDSALAVDGVRIPVRWLLDHTKQPPRYAAFFYAYDGRPVRRPSWAMLRAVPERLLTGQLPLTLVMISGPVPSGELDSVRTPTEAWLEAAWRHFAGACLPSPESSPGG